MYLLLMANDHRFILDRFFQADSVVSRSRFAEEDYPCTNSYLESLWPLRKEMLLDNIFTIDRACKTLVYLPQWSLLLYQTAAYCI